ALKRRHQAASVCYSTTSGARGLALVAYQIVMLCGLTQYLLHVFGQQIAGLYESLGRLSHLLQVSVSGRIALRNGAPGISSRLARCAGRWERNRRPHQGAARRRTGGQGLTCPTDVSMAQIPTGAGRQWHCLEG